MEVVKMLGDLSAKYESNGNPGTISTGDGDSGGKSYGMYQFASNAGTPQNFVEWLLNNGNPMGNILSAGEVGSREFDVVWMKLAQDCTAGFAGAQHEFIEAFYFTPAVDSLGEIGIRVLERSEALQQVLWSRAVQYGPKWMTDLFKEAARDAGQELFDMSDRDLIWWIYEVNLTDPDWTAGSPSLRPGLFARFEAERTDALNMLEGE